MKVGFRSESGPFFGTAYATGQSNIATFPNAGARGISGIRFILEYSTMLKPITSLAKSSKNEARCSRSLEFCHWRAVSQE